MVQTDWALQITRLVAWALRLTAGIFLLWHSLWMLYYFSILPDSFYDLINPVSRKETVEFIYWRIIAANFILLAIWCGLVNRILRKTAEPQLARSPLMAALWHVIPIACFFMPYLTVKELYQASHRALGWKGGDARLVLLWWIVRMAPVAVLLLLGLTRTTKMFLDVLPLTYKGLYMVESGLQIWIVTRIMRWRDQSAARPAQDLF